MTAPVYIVGIEALDGVAPGDVVTVEGGEGRHGVAVRRLRAGEAVDLVDGAGRRTRGAVAGIERDRFAVLLESVTDEPAQSPTVVVVQALVKGERGELAVEMLTECGVDVIVPWAAENSIAVWREDRAERGLRRWRSMSRAATKQSRRSRLPNVASLSTSRDVANMIASATLGLVFHESATALLASTSIPTSGRVVLVIGPEGGISPAELALFANAGGLPVRMGDSVLRASTAGVAAASIVMVKSGRWSNG